MCTTCWLGNGTSDGTQIQRFTLFNVTFTYGVGALWLTGNQSAVNLAFEISSEFFLFKWALRNGASVALSVYLFDGAIIWILIKFYKEF